MDRKLRVLVVEDSLDDAALLVRELKRGGIDAYTERVDTADGLTRALGEGCWDAVISDYSMPRFSAPQALEIVTASGLDLPFIIVSGTIGEDVAVQCLKAGAHDFLVKGKLARLVPALERELRDAELRRERRRMQEQLVLSDRMVSVGTLAAGVAHEINNPLAAVIANLEYLDVELARLGEEAAAQAAAEQGLGAVVSELTEPLRDARFAAQRVREIVRDLKLFSRPDEERHGPVDVHRILDSTLRMAENEIRHRARLVKDYGGDLPPVDGNEARLGQVFLNLVVNAAQAMAEGSADRNEIRVVTRRSDDDRVTVEVHDTGSGISPALLPRVFDPFFTTKPVGIGTGLGLAICHRIVTAFGGEIAVDSELGSGSVFRVALPAAAPVSEDVIAPIGSVPPRRRRRARILAVDDEAMVGMAVRRMLANDHEVTALTDARAALERLQRGERYDVVLCNVMMPFMGGPELHAEVARLAPEQAERMIFMTGGAFTPAAHEFLDRVPNDRIEKPFDAPQLKQLVDKYAR